MNRILGIKCKMGDFAGDGKVDATRCFVRRMGIGISHARRLVVSAWPSVIATTLWFHRTINGDRPLNLPSAIRNRYSREKCKASFPSQQQADNLNADSKT